VSFCESHVKSYLRDRSYDLVKLYHLDFQNSFQEKTINHINMYYIFICNEIHAIAFHLFGDIWIYKM
jgi:hypothetical protein